MLSLTSLQFTGGKKTTKILNKFCPKPAKTKIKKIKQRGSRARERKPKTMKQKAAGSIKALN